MRYAVPKPPEEKKGSGNGSFLCVEIRSYLSSLSMKAFNKDQMSADKTDTPFLFFGHLETLNGIDSSTSFLLQRNVQ